VRYLLIVTLRTSKLQDYMYVFLQLASRSLSQVLSRSLLLDFLVSYSKVPGRLSFAAHVDYILKVCSQRIFLLKQLRAQGMPLEQLHTVFQAIILQRLAYALPAWGPFLSADLKHKIDGFLKGHIVMVSLKKYTIFRL